MFCRRTLEASVTAHYFSRYGVGRFKGSCFNLRHVCAAGVPRLVELFSHPARRANKWTVDLISPGAIQKGQIQTSPCRMVGTVIDSSANVQATREEIGSAAGGDKGRIARARQSPLRERIVISNGSQSCRQSERKKQNDALFETHPRISRIVRFSGGVTALRRYKEFTQTGERTWPLCVRLTATPLAGKASGAAQVERGY